MTPPSEEQIHQRIDMLPEDVRTAFFDEKTNSILWQIGEKNHLSDDRIRVVARFTGYALLDLIHPEDLAKELENTLHLDHQVATAIGKEITMRIIKPVLENPRTFHTPETPESNQPPKSNLLSPAFKEKRYPDIGSAPATADSQETTQPTSPQPPPPAPETPTPSATSVPAFERPSAPQEKPPAAQTPSGSLIQPQIPADDKPTPFIIHEEKEMEPLASGKQARLSRPHFFKSTAGDSTNEKAVSARLEIGEESQVEESPRVGRTEKEEVRVVNYTDPEFEVDPFKRPAEQTPNAPVEKKPTDATPREETPKARERTPTPDAEESKEISPDNIINLKDLPQ